MSAAEQGPRVLFLGGVGRSGTTMLDRMVGGLPDAVSVGEVVHLWHRGVLEDERCGCGEPFSRCGFWQAVGQRAFGGWMPDLARHVIELRDRCDRTRFVPALRTPGRSSSVDAAVAEVAEVLDALYRAIAEVAGAQVVVDSSKHASYAYLLRRVPALDLRVVHVVRTVEGVTYSWQKQVARPETADGRDMPRYSPARVAVRWVAQNVLLERLVATGVPGLRVRYEDVVADPRGELTRIGDALGIEVGAMAHVGADWVDLAPAHTVAGNPMRFRTGRTELRSDDAWRGGLSRSHRGLVRAMTLPVAGRYGYAPTGRRAAGRR